MVTAGALPHDVGSVAPARPHQVKCKLMSSARAATDGSGKRVYTVFQQGAGQVDAYGAVFSSYTSFANVGLNIAADLAGTQRFGGPARQRADGTHYVVDGSGNPIDSQGYLWSNGHLWSNGYLWQNGSTWSQSFVPSVSSFAGINNWVEQE